ncbi:MAG: pilus assembly protein TadG-related protein [Actinomycetota bacterium]|nr:pilus assembly protein TadG-related protein [Actinomycetota bacterium]
MTTRLRSSDTGSITVWMLGVCVTLLFLGGISLDLWRVLSERHALAGLVDAAAIAGASGIDEEHFRATGQLQLAPGRAEGLAAANLAAQADKRSLTAWNATASTEQITVTAAGAVEFTLLKVLVPDTGPLAIQVRATAPPRRSP